MTYRFFHAVETLEDLRAQYKKLAMQYRPDRGGGRYRAAQGEEGMEGGEKR